MNFILEPQSSVLEQVSVFKFPGVHKCFGERPPSTTVRNLSVGSGEESDGPILFNTFHH